MSRVLLVLLEKMVIVVTLAAQELLDPPERLERGLRDLLQLSQDPLGSEVKPGLDTQDPQEDYGKPDLKDAIRPLQVLAGQPEQLQLSQAQQGRQERLDRLVTQPVRQEP